MIHFLPGPLDIVGWVNSLDAIALAHQVKEAGADYFIFTLGQNNGQYNSRNESLTSICPKYAERDIHKDVIEQISDALNTEGIKLILYIPIRGPQGDNDLLQCLGDRSERTPPTELFIRNWSSVLGHWYAHHRSEISGWWLDGAYATGAENEKSWKSFCKAIGSDEGIFIAANPGEGAQNFPKRPLTCQSATAGEFNSLPSPTDIKYLAKQATPLTPHILTPLGAKWGSGASTRYTCEEIRESTMAMTSLGGMLTFEVSYANPTGINSGQITALGDAWIRNCGVRDENTNRRE